MIMPPVSSQDAQFIRLFQTQILNWFAQNARSLPWRETSDPYRIWISEIMLQQTQVATVVEYYKRFLERFPDLQSLAAASEEEVLKYWEGLGYYRRGKNLRLAAQMIIEKFGGEFPRTHEELLSLPGIGPYSAGAILSIAFRLSAPALDGNLIRVYSRYYGIQKPVDETQTLKKLWNLARSHSPQSADEVREFAEGMMELGALVCTPQNPRCNECPLRASCQAHHKGLTQSLPRKKRKAASVKKFELIYFSTKKDRVALLPKGSDRKYPDFRRLPFKSLSTEPRSSQYQTKFKYSVTHRHFLAFVSSKLPKRSVEWIKIKDLSQVLLPAIDRRILKHFLGG